jgi:orotidine-5'-phosphate decarboxylase
MEIKLTDKEQEARKKVCLPLDGLYTLGELEKRVDELSPVVGLFKIGKESFTRFGPDAVGIVQDYGANVFLDLKYKDIPNTVRGAASAAAELGVYMFNVHATGGVKMMEAAVDGAAMGAYASGNDYPLITAVTILTSIDEKTMNEELRVSGTVEDQVVHLAKLAHKARLDGVVCSPKEVAAVKAAIPDEYFMCVNPGIQHPKTANVGKDQARVLTPSRAIESGSDIMVVGRAITGYPTAEERLQAGYEILQDAATKL